MPMNFNIWLKARMPQELQKDVNIYGILEWEFTTDASLYFSAWRLKGKSNLGSFKLLPVYHRKQLPQSTCEMLAIERTVEFISKNQTPFHDKYIVIKSDSRLCVDALQKSVKASKGQRRFINSIMRIQEREKKMQTQVSYIWESSKFNAADFWSRKFSAAEICFNTEFLK